MRAVQAAAYGSPDILALAELDDPVPGDSEVLIDIAAASVNPIDWKIISGAMKAFYRCRCRSRPASMLRARSSPLDATSPR
ncbi:hypothetical protein [Caballeronia sp. AZ7_KS35]|uniref:hypothetical protein n=1 Tax=Caballeronia sp. AZ7_KS35 TaxID=2921762 RepID=UPI002029430B|nr:hypothetical protein [Caballeronia sp. AZ7_KS35]